MRLTDDQVEKACDTLGKAINAAQNSNHNAEVFVVAAAQTDRMIRFIEMVAGLSLDSDEGVISQDHLDDSEVVERLISSARSLLDLCRGGRAA